MKTAIVLILAIAAQAMGNVYLTKAMKVITSDSESSGLLVIVGRAIESPTLWLGVGLLMVFFALYSAALSWADLSFVLPATAFGYVLNVWCGHYFLNESVSKARWAGSIIITLGVVLVSRSGVRTIEPARQSVMTTGGGQ